VIETKVTQEKQPYIPCSTICPRCSLRYGEPKPHGYIDLKHCQPCKDAIEAKRFEPSKKRRGDYYE
jgi:hypothetical protein